MSAEEFHQPAIGVEKSKAVSSHRTPRSD